MKNDTANCAALSKCAELAKCGLEVKPCAKMRPRVIIHDIPVKLSGDEIVNCIVNQNLPHASIEDIKLVYLFPAVKKKARSCVVELKAEHRLELIKRKGVNINWLVVVLMIMLRLVNTLIAQVLATLLKRVPIKLFVISAQGNIPRKIALIRPFSIAQSARQRIL